MWRAVALGMAVALLAAIGTLAGAPSAQADQALDMNQCLSQTTGSLTLSRPSVVWAESLGVTWSASPSTYCAGMGVTLQVQADGLVQSSTRVNAGAPHGTVTVTPARTTSASLVAVNGAGSRTLASVPLTVDPWDPEPLTADMRPSITLLDNAAAWRRLFVRAVRTPGQTVIIKGDLDLSGLDGVYVAPGVRIIGDRSVRGSGPRLRTRTFPSQLLHVGDDAHGPSDNVRITGIRLDGGMSDDPFSGVGPDDADGIVVRSGNNIEIDHNEIDHWKGSGVNVRDPDGHIRQDNADTVRIHDNYIHHNQHPSADTCLGAGGHAGGYGVVVSEGAYALIEANVFDWNRHAIAGDGRAGSGYKAYRNLILQNGGVHFRCVQPEDGWTLLLGLGITIPLTAAGVLDNDHIYHTHQIDMHGRGDNGFGGLAGEWMDVRFNTVLYTAGNGIKLRGTPDRAPDSPPTASVGMDVSDNVFAHEDQWAGILSGALSPGAMTQEASGLHPGPNTYGLNTFNERKQCDLDGDRVADDVIATGVTWWYRSTVLGGRWVFLEQSPTRLAAMTLADVNGDGRCDVQAGGVVHPGGGDGSRPIVRSPGAVTTITGSPVDLTLAAAGGTAPHTWVVSGLPTGLTASPSGRITGTPTAFGVTSSTVTATVTSANHQSDTVTFTWTIGSIVPTVTGTSEDAARRAMATAGLPVGNVTRQISWSPAGTVIAQSLTGGSIVATRTPMDITVSLGAVTVPNVRGWDPPSAGNAIRSAGLTVGGTSTVNTCLDPGSVQGTTPAGGSVVAPGTVVSLSVSTCTGSGGDHPGGGGGGGNPRQPL
jgi:hypothetical protein